MRAGEPGSAAAQVRLLVAQEILPDETASPLVNALLGLCRAAAGALGGSGAGVSMTMVDQDAPSVVAASDPVSQLMEEMQFIVGEGPCLDALAARRPVLQPDLDGEQVSPWPGYTAAALAYGVHAVFAFPLQVGAARLGVLDLYRNHPGSIRPEHLLLAFAFAELAVAMMLDGQEAAAPNRTAGGLDDVIADRPELYQAQGMVMVQLRVSLAEAMVRLRAYAFAEDRRLSDIAGDVVGGRLRLDEMTGT